MAEILARSLEKQGKREKIIPVFDAVSQIPLPGLMERMTFLKCLWLAHALGNPKQAHEILSRWQSYEEIEDAHLLQLFLDLRGSSFSLLQRIAITNKIIKRSDSPLDKLQYSNLKTMLTIMLGEIDEAKEIHESALNTFFQAAAEATDTGDAIFAALQCAAALELQGILSGDKMNFERALTFLDKIAFDNLLPLGVARVLYEKGRLNWLKRDFARAAEYFSQSLKYDPQILPIIYRMDSWAQLDDFERARADLSAVRRHGIEKDYALEFLRGAATLAVRSGDVESARSVTEELKELQLDIQYFQIQRDELCIDLLEFASAPKKAGAWNRICGLSNYLHLKPNIFGLGLNINKFFERKHKGE
ncbi:MAG: hypothetical protein ABSG04_08375 [Verrucomicrobiota bacterium]